MVARTRFGRFLPANPDPFDPRVVFDRRPAPRQIPLSWPGVCATVDDLDFDWLNKVSWQVHRNPFGKRYAQATLRTGGRKVAVYMHRLVACQVALPPTTDHSIVDHLDGDSLNNRRSNLRWATPSQNSANRHGLAARQTDFLGTLAPMRPDDPANPCTPLLGVIIQLNRG